MRLRALREQFETLIILRSWREYDFNITKTASALKVSRHRVRRAVKPWRTGQPQPAAPLGENE